MCSLEFSHIHGLVLGVSYGLHTTHRGISIEAQTKVAETWKEFILMNLPGKENILYEC